MRAQTSTVMMAVLVSVALFPAAQSEPSVCVYRYYYYGYCVDPGVVGDVAWQIQRALDGVDARADATVEDAAAAMAGQQRLTPLTDLWYMKNEPDVTSSGTTDLGTAYPADDNGIAGALMQETQVVMNVKYGVSCWPYAIWCSVEKARELSGQTWAFPGEAAFIALYGTWSDLNGDGWVQDRYLGADQEIHDNCAAFDDEVSLRTFGQREPCSEDEWAPLEGKRLVGYVTPGDWSRDGFPRSSDAEPDLLFQDLGHGVYYAPGQLFPSRLTSTGSLTGTIVLEGFEGVPVTDGERDYQVRPHTRSDVDLLMAVDPTVEAVVNAAAGQTIPRIDGATNDLLDVLPEGTDGHSFDRYGEPVFGPTDVHVVPEASIYDYANGWHPYLDVRLTPVAAAGASGIRLGYSLDALTTVGPGGQRIDGPSEFALDGRLGLWHDVDGDGWIGSPRASDHCPDVYDCGQTSDPNEYQSREFHPVCVDDFHVRVRPEGATWQVPVYQMGPAEKDVDDVTAHGDLDRLHWDSGAIDLLVHCEPWSGRLWSDDRLVFPLGTLQQGVHVDSDVVYVEFYSQGVQEFEGIWDEDLLPAAPV